MRRIVLCGVMPVLVLFFAGCNTLFPEGEYITEYREVEVYDSVSVEGGIFLVLTDDSNQKATVTTYENIRPYVETFVKNKKLIIRSRKNIALSGGPHIRVEVNGNAINSLNVSGGCSVYSSVTVYSPSFSVRLSGGSAFEQGKRVSAADISFSVSDGSTVKGVIEADTFHASLSGSSLLDMKGSVKLFSIQQCTDGSAVRGFGLSASVLSCNLSGGSDLEMTVLNRLSVVGTDGSIIKYKGMPKIVTVNLSDGSSLEQQ